MAKEKIRDLVGILFFYFLIVFGVIIVNQSLGRVIEADNNNNISVTN